MRFEVFDERQAWEDRVNSLRRQGCTVFPGYNGRLWTIRWKP